MFTPTPLTLLNRMKPVEQSGFSLIIVGNKLRLMAGNSVLRVVDLPENVAPDKPIEVDPKYTRDELSLDSYFRGEFLFHLPMNTACNLVFQTVQFYLYPWERLKCLKPLIFSSPELVELSRSRFGLTTVTYNMNEAMYYELKGLNSGYDFNTNRHQIKHPDDKGFMVTCANATSPLAARSDTKLPVGRDLQADMLAYDKSK